MHTPIEMDAVLFISGDAVHDESINELMVMDVSVAEHPVRLNDSASLDVYAVMMLDVLTG